MNNLTWVDANLAQFRIRLKMLDSQNRQHSSADIHPSFARTMCKLRSQFFATIFNQIRSNVSKYFRSKILFSKFRMYLEENLNFFLSYICYICYSNSYICNSSYYLIKKFFLIFKEKIQSYKFI